MILAVFTACSSNSETSCDEGCSAPGGSGSGASTSSGGGSGGSGGTGGGRPQECPPQPTCANISFAAPVDTPTSKGPNAVAIDDFDGDKILDVAFANTLDTMTVHLGLIDGSFGPPVTQAAGDWPRDIAASDLNADGTLDLVVANSLGNTVSVYLNQGQGTFAPQVTYAAESGPFGVAAGDLNGDDRPDIVTANDYGGTASVLYNQGDGTFEPQMSLPTGGQGPLSVRLGDLTGDGLLDIVVANGSGTGSVVVIVNEGGGSFAAAAPYDAIPFGNAPDVVALGDLNGDMSLDVVTANTVGENASGNTVGVFMNTGNGTLADEVSYAAGIGLTAMVLADLDGDGELDAAVPNGNVNNVSEGTVSVLRGAGDGTFAPRLTFPAGTNPWALAAGDIDCDGRPDLVVGIPGSNTLTVLTNTCQ
jgi:hypothetical protein